MALFSVLDARDAPITKDFTKITMPDGTVEVVRKIAGIDSETAYAIWSDLRHALEIDSAP